MQDTALAVGITALPTPEADSSSDWHVYEWLMGSFTFVDGTGFDRSAGVAHHFDSKAMRKVDAGQDLVAVVEAAATSSGLNLRTFSRTLIKLH